MNKYARSLILCCIGINADPLLAQNYPIRPIRLVIPSSPGGTGDVMGRIMAQRLGEALGQQVVIDNRPGAGTNIGSEIVVKAPPDGYTLLDATSSVAINVSLYRNLSFDPVKDLAPVIMLTHTPNVLAVHPSVPAKSVRELIALARSRPGQLSYASSGNGTTNHLAMELFKSLAKVDLVHIPYKGGGPALTDLISGQIHVMLNPPTLLMGYHKTGKVRALAVGSEKRVEGIDLPTVAETLPGFESTVWFALFAPAGTPRPIIEKLNSEVERILKDKRVVDSYKQAGLFPVGGTPEQLGETLKSEIGRWAKVVALSGAKVD